MRERNNRGFTLIEIMIVVAIVGILGAIAYPAYTDHVRKARRADGMTAVLNAANAMERCGSTFGRYDNANCAGILAAQNSPESYYSVTGVAGASTYTFTAAAQNQQLNDAGYCNSFAVDQAGTKTSTGSEGNDRCWNR